jgi:cyclic beta-1,2-glucan synthetase
MLQDAHIETFASANTKPASEEVPSSAGDAATETLRIRGEQFARSLEVVHPTAPKVLYQRRRALQNSFTILFQRIERAPAKFRSLDDFRWLQDNVRLLHAELRGLNGGLKPARKLPHVVTGTGEVVPRCVAIASEFFGATECRFQETEFTAFLEGFQRQAPLELAEFWVLGPSLALILLEKINVSSEVAFRTEAKSTHGIGRCVRSLRDVSQVSWKEFIEPLVLFDLILRQDPVAAYAEMDFESRELYRKKLAKISKHSSLTEMEVAGLALALAKSAAERAYSDPRVAQRESHIGYYIVAEGANLLCERAGYQPPFTQKVKLLVRRHPDEFYLPGIEILTFVIMAVVVWQLTAPGSLFSLTLVSMLVLLLPASQSAVQLMNYLITSLLPAEILPKLDFAEGVPETCTALVAVPSLLLNEKQVRGLVEDLEIRFLGNHDPNVHFALLTDLPDSREGGPEDSPLIDLCAKLIGELNDKYDGLAMGSFFLFHRHRVYNPSEGVWMGWERKRGKLLDLNKLLRGQYDSFPVKIGDLSLLPQVRFVLTLDSDTELPRGSAQRMIGTIAHPLHQAIIDPAENIVVAGYGILQPRVGVSVQSTARTRLASIYAGETGLDIYTRAVSDAYQDLFGEGSFTGKGIYEVDVVHQVLDRRFPRNSLLSHDLIEGAYARAGLVSDIEVIEDYPSHYSAYNRRKHRWLRGDWQIAEWLFPYVTEESGQRVRNPISLLSWWKIFDNLRRSLVEPATFLLLMFGWLLLDGSPFRWTVATLCILFIPSYLRFVFNLVRAAAESDWIIVREALSELYASNVNLFFTLIFLAHQTLLALDAMGRALVRRIVTNRRLLEWETAAQAEAGNRRTPVDRYLDWMPVIALALGVLVLRVRPTALPAAIPVLLLWACSKEVSAWLNHSPVAARSALSKTDQRVLRSAALRTWRYFAEYSTPEHNWLVPDCVQEEPPLIAAKISPTNLGLLLNARQVACEFGYLTVLEFVEQTVKTLSTASRLEKYRGHLLNWYDTRTLQPLEPLFVSTVDSGNLLASLWTLRQGALQCMREPLVRRSLSHGLRDCLQELSPTIFTGRKFAKLRSALAGTEWLPAVLNASEDLFAIDSKAPKRPHSVDAEWVCSYAALRISQIKRTTREYLPWLLPEYVNLRKRLSLPIATDEIKPENLPTLIEEIIRRLERDKTEHPSDDAATRQALIDLLPGTRINAKRLLEELRTIADVAGSLGDKMEFRFLLDRRRKLLSIGYDVTSALLQAGCYDLLASESRTAVLAAIAKEDIPQECWFALGRAHTLADGRPVLLSWTGTLFEYLMPSLWMRTYPNTLLDRSQRAAVRAQQTFAASKNVPWGISESAYFKFDAVGNYQYHAFGLPNLALRRADVDALVLSPYSTMLSLSIDPVEGLRNLRRMCGMRWFGPYGFYEAADYSSVARRFWQPRYRVVRSWMAHHQGMSLLAMANFLRGDVVQHWFHSDRRVQATELLLHEKPVGHVRRIDVAPGFAA